MYRPVVQSLILASILWLSNGQLEFYKGPQPDAVLTRGEILPETMGHIWQKVDHFSSNEYNTFIQRFYRYDKLFTPGSPIFVNIAGPYAIYPGVTTSGRIYQLAQEFNALILYPEQRFYGFSQPTKNTALDNLNVFTIEQILADLANLIVEIKKEPGKENSPVIVIGGWYSGSLAMWFRQRYPELAIGAWASSAPLVAHADYRQFQEIVGAAYKRIGGSRCYGIINDAFNHAEQLIAQQRFDELRKSLRTCQYFEGDYTQEAGILFSTLASLFDVRVITNDDDRGIKYVCTELENSVSKPNTTALDALGHWHRLNSNERCFKIDYKWIVNEMKQNSWLSDTVYSGVRQMTYQMCTQFGLFSSSNSTNQPFGSSFPVSIFYKYCQDIYGISQRQIDESLKHTTVTFGGLRPNVTNVFITQGEFDPWRLAGIETTQAQGSAAMVIKGVGQSMDLHPLRDNDSDELRAAKLKIKELIQKWIN